MSNACTLTQAEKTPSSLPLSPLLARLTDCYHQPFLDLLFQAQQVHREFHPVNQIQLATLANIKSGRCPEDCAYCPQSVRYQTGVESWDLPTVEALRPQILAAKANGSSRFCMGAAWRTPPHDQAFEQVLNLVRAVVQEGMEACVTLGMLTADQAKALKAAGLTAYNHNIDTAPDFYREIISTRTFEDRLETLHHVGEAGLQVCCGGILGMGETVSHRLQMLQVLCELEHPPESVPINCLVPIAGTPLANQPPVDPIELVRTIAVTRIFLPAAKVRLSAGRTSLSEEAQALCFMAGANSIFAGSTLLTTPNPGEDADARLMQKLGLSALAASTGGAGH
ncbi:MAG: biotin synthase BioB [Candidatus Melainabacteria bacterium]|nr:biotin synthase BioB [Candidatus Melainabacteria bacterium]